ASAPHRFRKVRPVLVRANSARNRDRMRPIQRQPDAFRRLKLRCLPRASVECPGPRQPSSPLRHREAEADFVFVCERTDPASFRDDSIPIAPLRATGCLPSWFLANGARSSFHVPDFSAWASSPEVCELAAVFVQPALLQTCSFSLMWPL